MANPPEPPVELEDQPGRDVELVGADPAPTDPEGIASASRSCLVIMALGVIIVLLICVSTAVRLIWG